jgi:HAD superfamily hydrolase (TIGR01549 family)
MSLSKYKAVIYDWVGTLSNSENWVVEAHNQVRRAFNLPLWTKEDIFSSSSLSARELYPQIYGDDADHAIQILIDYTTQNNLSSAIPYEGAEDLLKYVQSQNIPQAVVSNKRHEPLNEVIDHLNWREYFESAVGAGFCKRDKPSAEPLLKCIDMMKGDFTAQNILYVGDTETDLLTARNARCDVAFIQSDKPRPDLVEKYNPVMVYDTIGQFAKVCLN